VEGFWKQQALPSTETGHLETVLVCRLPPRLQLYLLDSTLVWLGYATDMLDTAANRTLTQRIRPGIRRLRVNSTATACTNLDFGRIAVDCCPSISLIRLWFGLDTQPICLIQLRIAPSPCVFAPDLVV